MDIENNTSKHDETQQMIRAYMEKFIRASDQTSKELSQGLGKSGDYLNNLMSMSRVMGLRGLKVVLQIVPMPSGLIHAAAVEQLERFALRDQRASKNKVKRDWGVSAAAHIAAKSVLHKPWRKMP